MSGDRIVDEDDFRRSVSLVRHWRDTSDGSDPELIDRIAWALGDERRKAKLPPPPPLRGPSADPDHRKAMKAEVDEALAAARRVRQEREAQR